MRDALANKIVAQVGKTRTAKATSRAPTTQAQKGASRLPLLLKPGLLSLAATGLASAMAAFLYGRANRTQPGPAAGDGESAPKGPTTSGQQRTRRAKVQDAGSSSATPTGDPALIGVAQTRKKRSDAGVKRGPRLNKANSMGSVADQLVPQLKTTDTSIVALTAGADTSADLARSPEEPEAAGHPS